MSETSQARSQAQSQAQPTGAERVPPQTRGRMDQEYRRTTEGGAPAGRDWGGITFASTLLMLAGAFQVIVGLTAIWNSDFYVVTQNGLLITANYTVWGWVHFGIGVLAIAAGMGLLTGRTWARALGITLAALSAIVTLAFVPAYPLWAFLVIALDVIAIYAIAVHGGRESRA